MFDRSRLVRSIVDYEVRVFQAKDTTEAEIDFKPWKYGINF